MSSRKVGSYLLHCGVLLILNYSMKRAAPRCQLLAGTQPLLTQACAMNAHRIWPCGRDCWRNAWPHVPTPATSKAPSCSALVRGGQPGTCPEQALKCPGSSDGKSRGAQGPGCERSQQLGAERFKASHFRSGCQTASISSYNPTLL